MGYHVSILRTASGGMQPISEEEVRHAIVRMDGRLDIMPGKPEFFLYRPELGEDSEILLLDDGELWAKNPGEPFLQLMIELAGHLGARVRGDELETYRSLEEVYVHPDDQAEWDAAHPPEPRRWIKSRAMREALLPPAVAVAIGLAIYGVVMLYRRLA